MDVYENPFRPGAGTRPPALAGRDDLIAGFRATLGHAKQGRPSASVMPVGLRGVGKTVLLNQFADDAAELGFRVGFIEAPGSGALAQLVARRVRKILLEFDRGSLRGLSTAVARALRVFKSFSVTLTPHGAASLALDIEPERGEADSGDLSDDLTDLLVATGEAAAERGAGVLLAIDEVQNLRRDEFEALIMAIHRTTQRNLPVVLVATGLPSLPGLAGTAKSYAERLFRFPVIGALNAQEAHEALEAPVRARDAAFTGEAIDAIVAVTQGYPYFLQEWGYEVWNRAAGSPIAPADVHASHDHVVRKLDESFFRVRFDRVTPAERRYLRAMAELGAGPHRSGEIADAYGAPVRRVAPIREGLIVKGMIYSPEYGANAFTVPLFDDFLRRQLPPLASDPDES